jgi:type II secretory pathway component PulJ
MDQLDQRLRDLETRVQALEKRLESGAAVSVAREKKQSAKEFLMTKSAGPETQKVLAFSYFLEHQDGLTSFNVSDLEAVFRAAREKLPKNMNDAVNKNVARGFLMEAKEKKDSKKAWQLTATGERFVEQEMGR